MISKLSVKKSLVARMCTSEGAILKTDAKTIDVLCKRLWENQLKHSTFWNRNRIENDLATQTPLAV
jgi:hypothetical protein